MATRSCPLCGGKSDKKSVYNSEYQTIHIVICRDCGCRTGDFKIMKDAEESWNKRFITSKLESSSFIKPE